MPMFLTKAGNSEILTHEQPVHVPDLSARRCHGRSFGRAARAEAGDQERGRDHRRLRVGPVVQVGARGGGQEGAEHQVQHPGCAASDDELHAVPACARRRVADRGNGSSAGLRVDPGAVGTARDEGAGGGRVQPVFAHGEERRSGGVRPLERLQVHGHGDPGVQGAREARTCGRSRRTSSSRTTRSPATRT